MCIFIVHASGPKYACRPQQKKSLRSQSASSTLATVCCVFNLWLPDFLSTTLPRTIDRSNARLGEGVNPLFLGLLAVFRARKNLCTQWNPPATIVSSGTLFVLERILFCLGQTPATVSLWAVCVCVCVCVCACVCVNTFWLCFCLEARNTLCG